MTDAGLTVGNRFPAQSLRPTVGQSLDLSTLERPTVVDFDPQARSSDGEEAAAAGAG